MTYPAQYKNVYEVVGFVIALGNAFGEALEDGKLSIADALVFWEPLSELGEAVNDFNRVGDEYRTMLKSPDELQALVDWTKEEFDVPEDNVEAIIEEAITAGLAILKFVAKVKK